MECLWERGDRNLLSFRSNDCFRSIEELNLTLTERQTLASEAEGGSHREKYTPGHRHFRVPSRIEVSQKSHEHLIETLLKAVGIYNAAAPAFTVSFWSLYPWRHPIAVWRPCSARIPMSYSKRCVEPYPARIRCRLRKSGCRPRSVRSPFIGG